MTVQQEVTPLPVDRVSASGEKKSLFAAGNWGGRVRVLTGLVLVVLVVLWLDSNVGSQYAAVTACTTAIAALGVYVVFQVGGITLAQAGCMAVAGYTSALMSEKVGIPVFVAMIVGVAASLIMGMIVGLLATRVRSEFHFILLTFAFSEIVSLVAEEWVYGADGVTNIPVPSFFGFSFDTDERFMWLALGVLAVCSAVVWWVMSSGLGRMFHTVRDGEQHLARSFGVGTSFYKILAMVIAAGLAGVAGTLQAHFLGAITPSQFSLDFSIMLVAAVFVGSMDYVGGAVLGSFALTFLDKAVNNNSGQELIVPGVALVLVALVIPKGLIGTGVKLGRLARANLFRLKSPLRRVAR